MKRPLARGGPAKSVAYAVCANGTSPGLEFFRDELTVTEQAQMLRLFDKMAATGVIANREKFKRVEGSDGLYEFKSFQIRMPCCFQPGNLVVITHGFRKKGNRIPPSEIDRAMRIKKEDLAHPGSARKP